MSESVSRRRVLLAVAAAPLAVACTTEPSAPPPPDPLSALAAQARSDAALAKSLTSVPAAAEIATARETHAAVAGRGRAGPAVSRALPSVPATAPPRACARHWTSRCAASEAVAKLPSYRAGLVGSVAAGCASLRGVLA
ncbi:hypothetical protein BBK82_22535 [Lentzea guizhouensis]|uniref:Uncharacterized protein n=1 Tax=Lentzea guizhouensis TaxID=1586287 RepID=A0A1B2HZ15_9PSEU|nr:hypothetical protein BBK82_22535 [Lentzea guizhouensis]